jgi:hypothetical protein
LLPPPVKDVCGAAPRSASPIPDSLAALPECCRYGWVGARVWPSASLLEVIDDRSQVRSTLVVSQLQVEAWHPALAGGDPTLTLAGASMRRRQPPPRSAPLRNDSRASDHQRVCNACGRSFAAHGRKTYCSDACRQRGFRHRQRPTDPACIAMTSSLSPIWSPTLTLWRPVYVAGRHR